MNPNGEIQPGPKVDALITNITLLMNEAEEMLSDSTSHHAERQVELLRTRCDNLRVHLAELCASAGRTFSAGVQRADQTIRSHPYEALAITLAAGVLCGAALGRRRN
jgi:ElaB/YqjD/DUF883 family membrane-anchored ribosome-binding protein